MRKPLRELEGALDGLYAAAENQITWEDALAPIRTFLDGSCVTIHYFWRSGTQLGRKELDLNFFRQQNLPPEFLDEYAAHYATTDVRAQHIFDSQLGEGEIYTDLDHIAEREMAKLAYYEDFLRKYDVRYCASCIGKRDAESFIALTTHFSPEQGSPDEAKMARVKLLAPHVRRATGLWRHVGQIEESNRSLAAALDSVPFGYVAVDARARIRYANKAAERILSRGRPISTRSGQLVIAQADAQAQLLDVLGRLSRRLSLIGRFEESRIRIVTGDSTRPMILHIVPSTRPSAGPADVAAYILIDEPALGDEATLRDVCAPWSLSHAEIKLLHAMLQGYTLAQYAHATGISGHTARTHLRNMLQKAGVGRQVDLVRLASMMARSVP